MIVLKQAAQQGLAECHGIDKDDILCDYVGADVFVWTTLCLSMCSLACTQTRSIHEDDRGGRKIDI